MDLPSRTEVALTGERFLKILWSVTWRWGIVYIVIGVPQQFLFVDFLRWVQKEHNQLLLPVIFAWQFVLAVLGIILSVMITRMVLRLSYSDFAIVLLPKAETSPEQLSRPLTVTWPRAGKVGWSIWWRGIVAGLVIALPFSGIMLIINALFRGVSSVGWVIYVVALVFGVGISFFIAQQILAIRYADFRVRLVSNK